MDELAWGMCVREGLHSDISKVEFAELRRELIAAPFFDLGNAAGAGLMEAGDGDT